MRPALIIDPERDRELAAAILDRHLHPLINYTPPADDLAATGVRMVISGIIGGALG
jgi:hypothetical protein